eukprot:3973233-Alexandrium_andersonii.AAC.1
MRKQQHTIANDRILGGCGDGRCTCERPSLDAQCAQKHSHMRHEAHARIYSLGMIALTTQPHENGRKSKPNAGIR